MPLCVVYVKMSNCYIVRSLVLGGMRSVRGMYRNLPGIVHHEAWRVSKNFAQGKD